MIIGTGLDLVEIARFRSLLDRWGERVLERLFTASERAACLARPDPVPGLAARFAAKEAFFKAAGTGYGRGGAWTDVEVWNDDHGAPALRLAGRAERIARERGARRAHVSLSHTGTTAAAHVVLEGG